MRPMACSARWCSAAGPAEGCLVEVSMLEAMAHFAIEPFAAFFALGEYADLERPPAARAGLHLAHRRPSPDRDPSLLAREVLGRPGGRARTRPNSDRIRDFPPARRASATTRRCNAELDRRFSRQPLSHWIEQLGRNDVPYAPINTHRRSYPRSAGRAPGAHRAGHGRPRRQPVGAPARSIRRKPQRFGAGGAAARRAWPVDT